MATVKSDQMDLLRFATADSVDDGKSTLIGRLLLDARRQPWFAAFYQSLPLAGVSGTLHDRMRGMRASGRCRAKTGTLSGVTALAGYCRAPDGDPVTFAILMNRINVWRGRRVWRPPAPARPAPTRR